MKPHDLSLLRDEYGRLISDQIGSEPDGAKAHESFLRHLFESVYGSIAMVVEETDSSPIPPLCIYSAEHPEESRAFALDENGIHVGLEFALDLDSVLTLYARFLLENFTWQTSPVMGDALPLQQLVKPEMFPDEALTMHAASLIPKAVAEDGYARTLADSLLGTIEDAQFAPADENLSLVLSRSLQKPVLDLRTFLAELTEEGINEVYVGDQQEYILSLHVRLLHDAVHFMLAHEIAHYLLGHHCVDPAGYSQSQRDESNADLKALEILDAVPGFQIRSLLTVFAFCHVIEQDIPPDRMDHPFARNRILTLNDTILKNRYDESLREDVNAGMAMMSTPLASLPVRYVWDKDDTEDLEIMPSCYSDLDHCAHLQLYLDRAPHKVEFYDGARENAFILSLMVFEASVVLRHRIHRNQVLRRGRVVISPGGIDGLFIRYSADSILIRMDIGISSPPEWWLGHNDVEFAIESLTLHPEPNDEPSLQTKIVFHLAPVDVDYEAYLNSLPPPHVDTYSWVNARLAARSFRALSQLDRAVMFFRHLHTNCPNLLLYTDLIDFAACLGVQGNVAEAGEIAQFAFDNAKHLRPKFSILLAIAKIEQRSLPEALNFAFLEMCGIGKYGEEFEQSNTLYTQIISDPNDPTMAVLREHHSYYKAAEDAINRGEPEEALASLSQALDSIRRAQHIAGTGLVVLQQYEAEVMKEIFKIEKTGHDDVRRAFENVLKTEPRFAPARVQLARLALEQGDLAKAERHWLAAHDSAPRNHFVSEFRNNIQERNPGFEIRDRHIRDAFMRDAPESEPGDEPTH